MLGLDGFALTDHDNLDGIVEAREKKDNLIFIPALEVSAKGAHVIALNPVEVIPSGRGIRETVDLIHDQGATAVLAHPYGFPRSWVKSKVIERSGFDAIEVANSAQFPYEYVLGKNIKLAESLGLAQTGGSDSHIPDTVGRAYTLIDSPTRNVKDILSSIRKGRTSWRGSPISLIERLKRYSG